MREVVLISTAKCGLPAGDNAAAIPAGAAGGGPPPPAPGAGAGILALVGAARSNQTVIGR